MNPEPEIRRLLDVMPASARMMSKLVSKPQQRLVITSQFPMPWHQERPIFINFDLWSQLSRPQRDLLLLRITSWLGTIRWFKPDLYQGVAIAGLLGTLVEFVQGDAVGVVVAGGLTAIAATQIWRANRAVDREIEADTNAIRVAGRRGYSEPEAARHLLDAIEAQARIEGRPGLEFMELIRCQNLRAIAGISPVGIPNKFN